MQNIMQGLVPTQILAPIDAVDTAAATSGWIDVRGLVGLFGIILQTGIVDIGSITYTFEDANTSGGGANAAILGLSTPTVVTTSNDPLTEIILFDANLPRGWIQVIGTVATGGVLVAYSIIALPKNSS